MSASVFTLPNNVKTFSVSNDTLECFQFDCKERMEEVTLKIKGCMAADLVRRLPGMKELSLYQSVYWGAVDDYPSLCNLIRTHFPHLTRLTFMELRIGNRNAKSILQSLRTHPNLEFVR